MVIDADEGKDSSDVSDTLDTPSSFTLSKNPPFPIPPFPRGRGFWRIKLHMAYYGSLPGSDIKSAFDRCQFSDAENEFASFGSKIEGSTSLTQTRLKPVSSKF